MLVSPSILAANFMNLESEINAINQTDAERLHIDVMDGHFVPPITFGVDIFKGMAELSKKPLDVHFMVTNPQLHIEDFAKAGASSIVFHIEVDPHAHRTLSYIKGLGVKAGITINPSTPISAIEHVLELCDIVLVMSVNPGYGGQSFINSSLDKIKNLADIRSQKSYNYEIQVDGGINDTTIDAVKNAGADCVIAGSYVFSKTGQYQEAIDKLR